MKLNHINLVVPDVAGAIRLFETYFNFTCTGIKGDHVVAILKGADDFTLVVMSDKNGDHRFPPAFHIGFILSDEIAVTDCYNALQHGGIVLTQAPGKIRDSVGFYFTFQNLLIEVAHYLPGG